ncbi:hypothetical protein NSE01_35350 [Novosphingobium sediminis]|uniref:DUF2029 domain-containing protein n=1 Tax=Novosphingobium sediminis TaxID=707214 RepID=A0A512APS2_9SPHN|nr:glycosyltransferase 87 family protein [Novosphingobium sediminis]GEO01703.1 hypothetical protein NSE01_35350 [Novosphingobium sediminis]
MSTRPAAAWGKRVEIAFALAVVALIARAAWNFHQYGYLPQPFFYEPSDTWMDWFNTAYWARDPGTYDVWGTIYPPLSFVVIRLLGIDSCYGRSAVTSDMLTIRDCDWLGIVAIHVIFAINIVLIARTFRKIDRKTALPRTVALALGMPMLFALERGNILLLTFTCFLLAFGPLLHSARLRWVAAGLAINFKVYLLGAVFALLLKRRWRWVEGALIATVLVYTASYFLLGTGTPVQVIQNITRYSSGFEAGQVLDIWYSITYAPLVSLLKGSVFPVTTIVGSETAEIGLRLISVLVPAGQISILLAAIAVWLRPEAVSSSRAVFLGTAMALISSEAGGYTQILVILLVFMEPWRGVARPIAIVLCYVLCLPGDIIIGSVPPFVRDSYLAGRAVEINMGVGLGMFLRPGILIGIAIAMSCCTISEVWRDMRQDGLGERRRFRRDARLLPASFYKRG